MEPSLCPRGKMIFVVAETDTAQRCNELTLVNSSGLGLQLCIVTELTFLGQRNHIFGKVQWKWFWDCTKALPGFQFS